ncbi:MAG: AMP-binding protein [Verrucomicrobia bacterium]|nr:AMP-binding protein [Verrucomicrobiota bacterium]
MTAVRCPVNEAAQISRDEPALVLDDREITYSQLEFYVTGACDRLQRAGCRADERVALRAEEPWQTVVLMMALLRLRAVACLLAGDETDPENMSLGTCRHFIGGEEFPRPVAGFHRQAVELMPVYLEGQDTAAESMLSLEQLAVVLFCRNQGDAVRGILYPYGSLYYGARGANHAIRLSSKCRWLSAFPLHEAAGLSALFRCLLSGAALVLPSPGLSLEDALKRREVSHVNLPPDGLERLLERGTRERFPRLRVVLVEGGEAHPALLQEARAAGWPVYPGFGIPEVASGITAMRPDAPPARQGCSGVALKYREVRVAADGEILVRGPALFAGYIETHGFRCPVDADGWFSTGERGRLGSDGYLNVLKMDYPQPGPEHRKALRECRKKLEAS